MSFPNPKYSDDTNDLVLEYRAFILDWKDGDPPVGEMSEMFIMRAKNTDEFLEALDDLGPEVKAKLDELGIE